MVVEGKVHSKSEYESRPGFIAVSIQTSPQDVVTIFVPEESAAELKPGKQVRVTIEPLG